jgi:hypothetical protein
MITHLRHMAKSSDAKPPSCIDEKLGNKRRQIGWFADNTLLVQH